MLHGAAREGKIYFALARFFSKTSAMATKRKRYMVNLPKDLEAPFKKRLKDVGRPAANYIESLIRADVRPKPIAIKPPENGENGKQQSA